MDLETLIVADAVSTPPDGKFYVHGGGITRLEIPSLPSPIPLGLLIRLKIDEHDLEHDHRILVTLIGPAGVPNTPPMELGLQPPGEDERGEPAEGEEMFVNIALRIPAVAVRAGLYRLQVEVDGTLAREVPIPVIVAEGPQQLVPREWPSNSEDAE
jgi:hypothetical protein